MKCNYRYTSMVYVTECPKCGHLYVKWLNFNKCMKKLEETKKITDVNDSVNVSKKLNSLEEG